MAVSGMGRSGLQKAEIRYGCKGSRQMVLGGKVRVGAAAHGQDQIPHLHITVPAPPHLDGQYASFGKVIEGMEVADAIVSVRTDRMDKPMEDQRMKAVTVETFGVDYPAPEKV